MVSQWYDPEHGSAGVPGTISRALISRGHDVRVLTGFPNYPTGKVYAGYRIRPYLRERMDGVDVHRVPLVPSHDRSALRRAANYLSFAAASTMRAPVLRGCDAVLVYSSPATAAVAAMAARSLSGTPYVLYVADLWPDSVMESGFLGSARISQAVGSGLHRFCNATYRRAHAVAVTSPGMCDLLVARGVPPGKVHVVPNWVNEAIFQPLPAVRSDGDRGRHPRRSGEFTVMYAGNLGDLQGLETAVHAMAHLRDLPELTLALVGSGVAEKRLRALVDELKLASVRFMGRRRLSEMPQVIALGDVHLVSLRDVPLFAATLPSKVQATLACGRPVVASVAGDAARIVTASGAGPVVPSGDPKALADALRSLYAMPAERLARMGESGRRYYEREFSERVGSERLESLLASAAGAVR